MQSSVARHRVVHKRSLALGISASVLVHAAILTLGPFDVLLPDTSEDARTPRADRDAAPALQVVTLEEIVVPPAPADATSARAAAPEAPSTEAASPSATPVASASVGTLAADVSRRAAPGAHEGMLAQNGSIVPPEVRPALPASEWAVPTPGSEGEEEDEGGGLGGLLQGLGGFLGGIKVSVGAGHGGRGGDCGPLIPNIIPSGPGAPGGIGVTRPGARPGGGIGRLPHSATHGTAGSGERCMGTP